jgi:hypothetical protein
MKTTRSDTRVAFPLRLPADLRKSLEGAARGSHRSLNGEIVFRLERSMREEEGLVARTSRAPESTID